MVVLDTRTSRRWSESSLSKPSGLMDWEDLSEMQQELISVLPASGGEVWFHSRK